jgi:phage replication-related protein YjqB (UPF0714/DUF867 family)
MRSQKRKWLLAIVCFLLCTTLAIASTQIDVLKAKSSMLSYLTSENCTIDPELKSNLGFQIGQQIRITVKSASNKYGLVTLHSNYQDGTDDDDIRMRLTGRQRFDRSGSFDAYIEGAGIRTDLSKAQCQSNNEYCEYLVETSTEHSDVVFCAVHGGLIENYTDEMAEWAQARVDTHHSKEASAWYAAGWQSAIGAYDAWHITSTDVSPISFTLLGQIDERDFTYAVSFHGYSGSDILVGGGSNLTLKNAVKNAIEDVVDGAYDVEVVTTGSYAGTSPDNFVNWLTFNGAGGVQIELPYGARSGYAQVIAEAVADVFADLL